MKAILLLFNLVPLLALGQPFLLSDPAFQNTRDAGLLKQLVSYWRLDEASGTRYDCIGSNHLTQSNGVAGLFGKVSYCADLVRTNTNTLSVLSATLQAGGSNITIATWALIKSRGDFSSIMPIVAKYGSIREYQLTYDPAAQRFKFNVSATGASATTAIANTFGQVPMATWCFLCGWTDGTNVNISVNNGTADQTAFSGATTSSTNILYIGISTLGGSGGALDGAVDEVGFWRRTLTAAERTRLYNSGLGSTATPFHNSGPPLRSDNPRLVWIGSGSNPQSACRVPHQHNSFYAQGLWWQFFTKYVGSSPYTLSYQTTADGVTWSAVTDVTTVPNMDANWTVEYDAATGYIHAAKTIQTGAIIMDGLYYRRGTPNSNGTITWDGANWLTAIATGNHVTDFSLDVGTDGAVWVGYNNENTVGNALVIKNSATDGTWSTAVGFPVALTSDNTNRYAIVSPLSGGGVYVTSYHWSIDEKAQGYYSSDGSTTFTPEANITDNAVESSWNAPYTAALGRITTLGSGGVTHLAYQSSARNIYYKSRSALGVWSAETLLGTTGYQESAPSIGISGSNIVVAWSDYVNCRICYCYYNGISWSAPKTFYGVELLTSRMECIQTPRLLHGNYLPLTWLTGDYVVKWRMVDFTL